MQFHQIDGLAKTTPLQPELKILKLNLNFIYRRLSHLTAVNTIIYKTCSSEGGNG